MRGMEEGKGSKKEGMASGEMRSRKRKGQRKSK